MNTARATNIKKNQEQSFNLFEPLLVVCTYKAPHHE